MQNQKLYLFIILACAGALTWRWWHLEKPVTEISVAQQMPEPTLPVQTILAPTPTPPAPSFVAKPTISPIEIEKIRQQSFDSNFLAFDTEGNIYLENIIIDDQWAVALGDILVGQSEQIIQLEQDGRPLSIPKPKLWPNATVPYRVDSKMPAAQKMAIEQAIDLFKRNTPIRFIPADNQHDHVLFRSGGQHCYSYVGRIGGEQEIVLGPDCAIAQIVHEMMHTLGFYHEQSRIDRDEYIMVMWENIEERFHDQFKKMPSLHQSPDQTDFDLTSIMMYPPEAFSRGPDMPSMLTLDGERYHPLKTLSASDIKRIKILYSK
jgi:hypothetical protein